MTTYRSRVRLLKDDDDPIRWVIVTAKDIEVAYWKVLDTLGLKYAHGWDMTILEPVQAWFDRRDRLR